MVPPLGPDRWPRGHGAQHRAGRDAARRRRAGRRYHARRLDDLEPALHPRVRSPRRPPRHPLDRGAGDARQDRALRGDPASLARPDRHRRARVHPLGSKSAARRGRGGRLAGGYVLGGRSLRDGEDLHPGLDLRHPGDRPWPLRAGQHASDHGNAGAARPDGRVPGEVERAAPVLLAGAGQASRRHDLRLRPPRIGRRDRSGQDRVRGRAAMVERAEYDWQRADPAE